MLVSSCMYPLQHFNIRKIYSFIKKLYPKLENLLAKRVKNVASASPPNLTSALYDLDFWPPDPQSLIVSTLPPLPVDQLCPFAAKSLHSFSKNIYHVHETGTVTNERTGRKHDDSGGGTKADRLLLMCVIIRCTTQHACSLTL